MSVLVVESFISEKLGFTYEEIKELVIYQYDIETKYKTKENENQNINLFKDDKLSSSSKIEYLYKYLSVKADIDKINIYTPVDRAFVIDAHKKNTSKIKEKYCMDGISLCKSEFFTDGLSSYYELLMFLACVLDMYKYKSQWEEYFFTKPSNSTMRLGRLLFRYFKSIYKPQYMHYYESSEYRMPSDVWELSKELLRNEENKRLYTYDSYIYLFDKIITIDYFLRNSDLGWKVAHQHAICNLSYSCSRLMLDSYDYKNALLYVGLAIKSDDYYLLRKAYNHLGYCAASSKNFKLAYDVLFSWFNSKLLISIKKPCGLDNESFQRIGSILNNDEIKLFKNQDSYWLGIMYDNFTYICRELIDLIEPEEERDKLILLAKYYADQAIKIDRNDKGHYYYKGRLYAKIKDYKKAIECFSKSINQEIPTRTKAISLRHMIKAYQHILVGRRKVSFDNVAKEYVSSYQDLLDESDGDKNNSSLMLGRDLFVLLSKCDRLSDKNKKLKYDLFEIDNIVNDILEILRRTPKPFSEFDVHYDLLDQEVKSAISKIVPQKYTFRKSKIDDGKNEIVYYTSLGVLKHLFSDVTLGVDSCEEDDKENIDKNVNQKNKGANDKNSIKINCLSVMHARYMNDPEEGLVFFKKFRKCFINEPEELREMLYDQKYVFLKSFTGLVDKLNMWTMYGTDHSTNSDCNGCCVCLAPETFSPRSVYTDRMNPEKWKHFDDDYGLYYVAYFDGDKIIVNGEESQELEEKFYLLKTQLGKIHKVIEHASKEEKPIITDSLVRMLEKLVFLVKDASYSQEVESRIILSRDINDRFDIKKTEPNPDAPLCPSKLFVNPPFQVYVKKLILGPKLEDADYWIPHLQYELSKMHDKWVYGEERDYIPKVRLSDINIR